MILLMPKCVLVAGARKHRRTASVAIMLKPIPSYQEEGKQVTHTVVSLVLASVFLILIACIIPSMTANLILQVHCQALALKSLRTNELGGLLADARGQTREIVVTALLGFARERKFTFGAAGPLHRLK